MNVARHLAKCRHTSVRNRVRLSYPVGDNARTRCIEVNLTPLSQRQQEHPLPHRICCHQPLPGAAAPGRDGAIVASARGHSGPEQGQVELPSRGQSANSLHRSEPDPVTDLARGRKATSVYSARIALDLSHSYTSGAGGGTDASTSTEY